MTSILIGGSFAACSSNPLATVKDLNSGGQAQAPDFGTIHSESLVVSTFDGLELSTKLDVFTSTKRLPVVVILEGSGPSDADATMLIPGPGTVQERCIKPLPVIGQTDMCKLDQMSARFLNYSGFAVLRMNKRGVAVDYQDPYKVIIDYKIHGTSTVSNRVKDIEAFLALVSKGDRLDLEHVYLFGLSEGVMVSAMFAKTHKDQIAGLAFVGPVLDTMPAADDFQDAVLPTEKLLKFGDTDHNGSLNEAEFIAEQSRPKEMWESMIEPSDVAQFAAYTQAGMTLKFTYFDKNGDGLLTSDEFIGALRADIVAPIEASLSCNDLKAYEALATKWQRHSTFAQATDYRAQPRTADTILALDIPVWIFVGELDGNTPARQLDWFNPMVTAAGRTYITATVVAGEHHNGAKLGKAARAAIVDMYSASQK